MFDQVLVSGADGGAAGARWAEVEARVGEVFDQPLETSVSLLRLAEARFRVEADVAEDAVELGFVGLFNRGQRGVNNLADIRLMASPVYHLEIGALGHD